MFAVPGWSVPAKSLVQEKVGTKNAKGSGQEKKSKKRKLDHTQQQPTFDVERTSQKRPRKDDERSSQAVTNRKHQHNGRKREVRSSNPQASKSTATLDTTTEQSNKSLNAAGAEQAIKRRVIPPAELPPTASVKLTPLQEKMRSKLTSARFRHLNETLYTTSSDDALSLFTKSPELFAEYHAGFSQQVKDSWPQNPVEGYIKSIRTRGALSEPKQGIMPLPRRKTGSCTIADLGCGDAPLARGCQSVIKALQLKFHNYDLHIPNSFVTKADISNLPLRDGEADIAVFCLSLMGTNWVSFVEEAWRIVRGDGRGEIWVAEVKSRFGKVVKGKVVENSVGKRRKPQKPRSAGQGDGDDPDRYDAPEQFIEDERHLNDQDDETDVSNFVKVFTRRGFQLKDGSVNKHNKMFVSMVFIKSGIPTAGKHKGLKWNGKEYAKQPEGKGRFVGSQKDDNELNPLEEAKALKPCVYKTR